MLLQFEPFPHTSSPQMSKKSDPVSSASKPKTNPLTPILRFIKRIRVIGKRVRGQSYAADKPKHLLEQKLPRSVGYPLLGSSSFVATTTAAKNATFEKDLIQQQQHCQGTARVALQQYDQFLDAIVITTLPTYPFCCHEDLLMMSRSQLVQTAVLFNSRLPDCSQIELADSTPDAHIRHSIEVLVGIIPDMPDAPKAIKSRRFASFMRVSRRQEKTLPVMSSPPHLLERLEEEDENYFFTLTRSLKKKR